MRNTFIGLMAGALLLAARPGSAQSPADPAADLWQRLGDTTLARLTAEALRANRDVVVAEARVRQARAARTNAALDLAPTITVGGGYNRQRTSTAAFGIAVPDRNLWDAGLHASWELDVFGDRKSTRLNSSHVSE